MMIEEMRNGKNSNEIKIRAQTVFFLSLFCFVLIFSLKKQNFKLVFPIGREARAELYVYIWSRDLGGGEGEKQMKGMKKNLLITTGIRYLGRSDIQQRKSLQR